MKKALHKSAEYGSWRAMKARCYNVRHKAYKWYGGKGIRVCDAWRDSFATFLADMGQKPSSRHTLDRIDSSADYEPGNCRWATPKEQARHHVRHVTIGGTTKTQAEWAAASGIHPLTVQQRKARGWTEEAALTTPPKFLTSHPGRKSGPASRLFVFSGRHGSSAMYPLRCKCEECKQAYLDRVAKFRPRLPK